MFCQRRGRLEWDYRGTLSNDSLIPLAANLVTGLLLQLDEQQAWDGFSDCSIEVCSLHCLFYFIFLVAWPSLVEHANSHCLVFLEVLNYLNFQNADGSSYVVSGGGEK